MKEEHDDTLSRLARSTRSPQGTHGADHAWRRFSMRTGIYTNAYRRLRIGAVAASAAVIVAVAAVRLARTPEAEHPQTHPVENVVMEQKAASDLHFMNQSLEEIMDALAAEFGVSISVPDSTLAAYRMTARFRQGETLEEILDILTTDEKFGWRIDDKTIIIHSTKK